MFKNFRRLDVFAAILAAVLVSGAALVRGAAQEPDEDMAPQRRGGGPPQAQPVPELAFRYMGPQASGRIASAAGVPGDTTVYYAGAASGGVWKSTDSGETFRPIFDDQPAAAIGALAVTQSNPNIVWAGTGEAWAIRDSDIIGDGIYKSTDAGATWRNVGLGNTGRIGRIIVHPTNPDTVFACALGRVTGKQPERGVFRTTNGGRTWDRVLFVDENTGCSGLSMDAAHPDFMVAGTWQVEMHPWAESSGGPGSGVYVSHDGGSTWAKATDAGLPHSPVGKIDVAIAPSNPQRVYALIQTATQGSLWRSDDGAKTWKVVSWDRTLIGRAGYYIRLGVNPSNPDEVMVANSSFHRSTDGGLTFPLRGGGCGDCHDIWIDPTNGDRWIATGDGGMGITTNHGQNFSSVSLPIGQMYHVATDNRVPYWIYSNRQDDGTMRGPSTTTADLGNGVLEEPAAAGGRGAGGAFGGRGGRGGRGGGGGGRGGRGGGPAWQGGLGGCESGFTFPAPDDPDIVWSSCYGNKLTRYDDRVGTALSSSPGIITLDSPPTASKYRCHWTPPLVADPFQKDTVYYGCQVVFKTTDAGQSWVEFSPDLSTKNPAHIVSSGGIVGDNLGQFAGEVVFAIAPSTVQRGLIWAGTNDGKLWYTTSNGQWVDVTSTIPGLPVSSVVSKIEPSPFDANTAYVAVDAHLMDDSKPYIYKTTDLGKTWTSVVGNLPAAHPLDYVKAVTENPNKKGMLFAGTGHAFYYSMDDGRTWTKFMNGLPSVPVSWIVVQKREHDVVISTYGRGLFILPDITLLEQTGQTSISSAGNRLFTPKAGVRQPRGGSAEFLFSLATAGQAKMEIVDSAGKVIRADDVPGRAGLNRATWNLLYESPAPVELRTTPTENPHVWDEARFSGDATRPVIHWGISGGTATPLAAPGKYSVRMTLGGQTFTEPFEIVKDPKIPASDADLAASTKTQVQIRDDIDKTVEMINHVEVMRREIEDALKANAGKDEIEKPLLDLDKKMETVEVQFISRSNRLSDDKYYVEAYRLYMNLLWLGGAVGTGAGDEAGRADAKPTNAQLQVLATLEQQLATASQGYTTLVNTDVPATNKALGGKVIIK